MIQQVDCAWRWVSRGQPVKQLSSHWQAIMAVQFATTKRKHISVDLLTPLPLALLQQMMLLHSLPQNRALNQL